MSGIFFLDWALLAVSLFNVVLMVWLGLTVVWNAQHRSLGVWLAGSGLLLGGVFFISHTAILGQNLFLPTLGMNFWWRVGWVPVVALPFAWYVVMLWYSGFWDDRASSIRRRQYPWFILMLVWTTGLFGLFLFTQPIPSLAQIAQFDLTASPSLGGIPVLLIIYPLYILCCISLSVDALLRPGPTSRVMGQLARRRARPWLMAAAILFLIISLMVGGAILWFFLSAPQRAYGEVAVTVAWVDLITASLISLAVVVLGQAVVSYEVFTGKTLPRSGLLRQWRNALILAAGYGVVVGWSLTYHLRSIYSLLATTLLMTAFYALFGWRTYAERERYVRGLRPFVSSQKLYEHLLSRGEPSAALPPEMDVWEPFRALCAEVLGARQAYLLAWGALAPLVDPPLAYPANAARPEFSLAELVAQFASPQTTCVPLDPPRYGGLTWAVPLWSERGLIGVLLLGEKRDGGLYTQEEIELARASGERLIDTQASVEVARRLMLLQRQRLAESQVLDRRARRVLHDEVLPRLHAALLALGASQPPAAGAEAATALTEAHHQIAELLREMPVAAAPEVKRLGLIAALRQMVNEEWSQAFEQIEWQIEAEAEREAQAIPPLTAEVLFYAARESVRNAARHGRRPDGAPLHLKISARWQNGLQLVIEDNGLGWGAANVPGGSGQGLALHSTLLAVVGGTLAVETAAAAYTRIILTLPAPVL